MTTIDKALLLKLRAEMNAALEKVAKDNGVLIKTGNASYTASTATFKVEIVSLSEEEAEVADELSSSDVTVIKAAADWKRSAMLFGLKPEWLGTKAKTIHGEFEVVGLMPRRRKYPVLVKSVSGLKLMTTEQVITAMKK